MIDWLVSNLAAYAVGFAACWILWKGCRGIFEAPVFERRNYRGHSLATAVGVLLPLALACVIAVGATVHFVYGELHIFEPAFLLDISRFGPLAVATAVGFSLLGVLDDIAGLGESGGFRGHLAALFDGRVTTGMVKMIGGPVIAIALMAGLSPGIGLFRDAALISLAANLANLFDRAPGRVNKVGQLVFAALVISTRNPALAPIAATLGAAAALLAPDLREEMMLGDSGSNVIGALIGLGVVLSAPPVARIVVLTVLIVLNLVSEKISFTKVIDGVGPLRRLDRLGAPHRPR